MNTLQSTVKADNTKAAQMPPPLAVAFTGLFVLALSYRWITGYMVVATVNLFLLLIGFTFRQKNRNAHVVFMSMGMLSDLVLVLILQFRRHAIQTALAFKLSNWNQAHIICSTTATALYIPMAIVGVLLFRSNAQKSNAVSQRSLHKKLGWITLIFRTLGFFLMFSMLGNR